MGITIFVLFQAIERLLTDSPEVQGLPVLIISIVSTLVMVASAFILGSGAGKEDLHMRSVLLDTVSDGISVAAVATLVSLVIGYGALKLLKDVYTELHKRQLT